MTAITSAQSIPAVPAALPAKYVLSTGEKRFVGLHMLFGLLALSIGSLFGPMQALEFAKVDLYTTAPAAAQILLPGFDAARCLERPGVDDLLHHRLF